MEDEHIPDGYRKCKGCHTVYCETLFPMKNGRRTYLCDRCTKAKNSKDYRAHPPKSLSEEAKKAKKDNIAQWKKDNPDKVREYNHKTNVIKGFIK